MTLSPHSSWAKSPRHFNPFQTEPFKVIERELNVRVIDKYTVFTPNDEKVVVEKFVLYSFWNAKDEEMEFVAEVCPPIDTNSNLGKIAIKPFF